MDAALAYFFGMTHRDTSEDRLQVRRDETETVSETAEPELEATRAAALLSRALSQCSAEDRLILRMRFDHGMTVAAIAQHLRLDAKQVYRRLERLLRDLRRQLQSDEVEGSRVPPPPTPVDVAVPSDPYVALLGEDTTRPGEVWRTVEEGLPFEAFERFQRQFALSADQAAGLVRIAPITLARRRQQGRLTRDESDRLLRMVRVFAKAVELFEGDSAAARGWLGGTQMVLGDASPLVAAKTEVGAREVEALIDRLEHGVVT